MIRIKVTVKNDQRKLSEDFESITISLPDDPTLLKWIEKVTKEFAEPVEDVTVSTKMDV